MLCPCGQELKNKTCPCGQELKTKKSAHLAGDRMSASVPPTLPEALARNWESPCRLPIFRQQGLHGSVGFTCR